MLRVRSLGGLRKSVGLRHEYGVLFALTSITAYPPRNLPSRMAHHHEVLFHLELVERICAYLSITDRCTGRQQLPCRLCPPCAPAH